MDDIRIDQLGAAASDALRRGDFARASSLFEQFTAAAPNDRRGWLGLAMARRDLGDLEAAHTALDGLLKRNWMDLPGLMMKGDLYAQRGDEKAAATFYNLVWSRSPAIASLPPDAAAQVQRAKAYCDAHSAALLRSVEAELTRAGYEKGRTSRRFSESIEILAGTARRYVEEPVGFFFAGLPATGFYPEDEFSWIAELESQTDAIAEEFEAAAQSDELFIPYVREQKDRPTQYNKKLLNRQDWSALFLIDDGVVDERAASLFPKTLAALEKTPLHKVPNRGPMILFSRLTPGTHIEPHTGFLNTRLICHLPIITPPNCALKVGNETREWKRGKALLFNDTIEHEARNSSDEVRVVLLFSVWRPELSEEEKRLISALMVSAYGFSGGEA